MKRILFLAIFLVFNLIGYSKNTKIEIEKLEIYAVNYDNIFTMHPTLDKIIKFGLYMRTTDYSDIQNSNLDIELEVLETKKSLPIDSLEIEGSSRAIVTIYLSDKTIENLYILDRGIAWKGRRYKKYFPLIASVYYFYPDRFFDKEYHLNKSSDWDVNMETE